jgi:hypothetical protein
MQKVLALKVSAYMRLLLMVILLILTLVLQKVSGMDNLNSQELHLEEVPAQLPQLQIQLATAKLQYR